MDTCVQSGDNLITIKNPEKNSNDKHAGGDDNNSCSSDTGELLMKTSKIESCNTAAALSGDNKNESSFNNNVDDEMEIHGAIGTINHRTNVHPVSGRRVSSTETTTHSPEAEADDCKILGKYIYHIIY